MHIVVRTHPPVAWDRVRVYEVRGHRQHRLATIRTNGHGVATRTLHLRPGKTYRIRCHVFAKGNHKAGNTPTKRVRVRRH